MTSGCRGGKEVEYEFRLPGQPGDYTDSQNRIA